MPPEPRREPPSTATWTSREAYLLAAVCLLLGLAAGYLLRSPAASSTVTASGTAGPAAGQASALPGSIALLSGNLASAAAPIQAALKTDPKNPDLLIQLGNLYYDHHDFPQAIDAYGRALHERPGDVNVRTDMGTALWYSGDPRKAVAEYQKALASDPTHAQTLFNLGVVYDQGLKDHTRAVATWEKLLKLYPQHPDKARILALISTAKRGN
jgi:cytochrome c-type biogenesis protein CcmH/NrfG